MPKHDSYNDQRSNSMIPNNDAYHKSMDTMQINLTPNNDEYREKEDTKDSNENQSE